MPGLCLSFMARLFSEKPIVSIVRISLSGILVRDSFLSVSTIRVVGVIVYKVDTVASKIGLTLGYSYQHVVFLSPVLREYLVKYSHIRQIHTLVTVVLITY